MSGVVRWKPMFCYRCGKIAQPFFKFCPFCGADFSIVASNALEDNPPINSPQASVNYKDLFQKIEQTLRKLCTLSPDDFDRTWGIFKSFHYKKDTDQDLYWKMVQAVFYSGMTAATVTKRLPAMQGYLGDYMQVKGFGQKEFAQMMDDERIIRNEKKLKACIANAKEFEYRVTEHGSFANYIESFGDLENTTVLEELRSDLRKKFIFLGPRTAYHFMLDMGLKVWKPDRVICRILYRLGLISRKEDIEAAVSVGREIAEAVGQVIRYIDFVFVKYGQRGSEDPYGLDMGSHRGVVLHRG